MNELNIFRSEEFGDIRTADIEGKIYFCGSDVAKALGYQRPNNAVTMHCRSTLKRGTPHPQSIDKEMNVIFIPEGDVYRLVVHSKLPNAERFESWIFDEVIPCIRKNGSYGMLRKQETTPDPNLYLEAAKIALALPDSQQYVLNCLRYVIPDIDGAVPNVKEVSTAITATIDVKPNIDRSYRIPFDRKRFNLHLSVNKISTLELSRRSGCCIKQIYNWKNGTTTPTVYNRERLCKALNLPVNYFDVGRRRRMLPNA